MNIPWLSSLIFVPWIGALFLLAFPGAKEVRARSLALTFGIINLLVSVALVVKFDVQTVGIQFAEKFVWIPTLGIEYNLGADGLTLSLILLSSLLVPFSVLASHSIGKSAALYFALILALQGCMNGVFLALNFFHWFIFWEMSLVPAFFLIKLWGGPSARKAAYQFFIYTLAGSVPMLLAFLAIYAATGTLDFMVLGQLGVTGALKHALLKFFVIGGANPVWWMHLVFFGILVGLAVKVPMFPFHTWQPLAYSEAPTPVSMLLTGVMSKMGVYGFIRILLPFFPDQIRAYMTPLLWITVIGIVLSTLAALVQKDLKKMLAYSSINHLGCCLLAIFAVANVQNSPFAVDVFCSALNGAMFQMFTHGLSAAAMFYAVGILENRSGGLRGIGDFGGLRKVAPIFCAFTCIASFASLGLPGLGGFIGEFLIFKGVFAIAPWPAAIAATSLLITGWFLLNFMQCVFHGPLPEKWTSFSDLLHSEDREMVPALLFLLILGVYPNLLLSILNPLSLQWSGWLIQR